MQLTNSDDQYGLIAKFFHWAIAYLILGLIPVGLGMGLIPDSPLKFEVYGMHKSFGLLVFFLGLSRLLWRFITPAPDHLETHKPWERKLASAAHFWLYVCIIGMPLSGWLMSSAGEFPVPFFGIQMPHLIGKDEGLGNLFYEIHEILAYTLLIILGLHIAGALKHHVLDKDETLKRMTWRSAGIITAAALVLLAGASYAVSALALFKDFTQERTGGVTSVAEEAVPVAASSIDTSSLPLHGWAIVPEKTSVKLKATLYGAEFTTTIPDVSGDILFNPYDLLTAEAKVRVGVKSLSSGDTERDASMKGADWLDSENYPDIWFVTNKFEKADGDNYIAIGTLTIKGKTMPLILPFALDADGKSAHMTASVTLNRLDFGIGAGSWEDEQTVGHTVTVLIDLSAIQ